MAAVTSFRDIRVWQYAMQLSVDIYQFSSALPPAEKPGLATELQQTVVRIPTLIATGHKSGSRSGMVQACRSAVTAAAELETLLIIVGQLYPNAPSNDLIDQLDEVQQMLTTAIKRLAAAPQPKKAL
ncbi:MAG: four helix bundle protein [Candidatus Saccharibacteria bacterium]|nr:four helix bundle protein [Candidatus Saccharibacteria bacterium]